MNKKILFTGLFIGLSIFSYTHKSNAAIVLDTRSSFTSTSSPTIDVQSTCGQSNCNLPAGNFSTGFTSATLLYLNISVPNGASCATILTYFNISGGHRINIQDFTSYGGSFVQSAAINLITSATASNGTCYFPFSAPYTATVGHLADFATDNTGFPTPFPVTALSGSWTGPSNGWSCGTGCNQYSDNIFVCIDDNETDCGSFMPVTPLRGAISFPSITPVPNFSNWVVTMTGITPTTTLTKVGVLYSLSTSTPSQYVDFKLNAASYSTSTVRFIMPKTNITQVTTSTIVYATPFWETDTASYQGSRITFTIDPTVGTTNSGLGIQGVTSTPDVIAGGPYYAINPVNVEPPALSGLPADCVNNTSTFNFWDMHDWKCLFLSGVNDIQNSVKGYAAGVISFEYNGVTNSFPLVIFTDLNNDISSAQSIADATTTNPIIFHGTKPETFGGRTLVILTATTTDWIKTQTGFDYKSFFDFILYAFIAFEIIIAIIGIIKIIHNGRHG